MSANKKKTRWAKLYQRTGDERMWNEVAVGQVSMKTNQNGSFLRLFTKKDHPPMEVKIDANTSFNMHQDTIIQLQLKDFDLAMSFAEKKGCDELWEQICQSQGKDSSVNATQDLVEESEAWKELTEQEDALINQLKMIQEKSFQTMKNAKIHKQQYLVLKDQFEATNQRVLDHIQDFRRIMDGITEPRAATTIHTDYINTDYINTDDVGTFTPEVEMTSSEAESSAQDKLAYEDIHEQVQEHQNVEIQSPTTSRSSPCIPPSIVSEETEQQVSTTIKYRNKRRRDGQGASVSSRNGEEEKDSKMQRMNAALHELETTTTTFRKVEQKHQLAKSEICREAKKRNIKRPPKVSRVTHVEHNFIQAGMKLVTIHQKTGVPSSTLYRHKAKLFQKGELSANAAHMRRERGDDYEERLKFAVEAIISGQTYDEATHAFKVKRATLCREVKKHKNLCTGTEKSHQEAESDNQE